MPIIKHEDVIKKGNPVQELTKSLEDLIKVEDKLIAKNKETAESFNLIKKSNDGAEAEKLINTTNKLKKSTSELTGIQKERLRLSKERERVLAKLITVENKQNEVLEKGKAQLRDKNKLLKANAVLNNKLSGTEERLLALNTKLRLERKKLNTETKKGQLRLKEINAELDKNNAKIRQNSDALKKQKIGIGKYSQALKGVASQLLGGLGLTAAIGFLINQFNKASERAITLSKSTNRLKGTFDITTKQAKKLAAQINAISTNFEDADPKNLEIALTSIVKNFENISESDALNLIEEGFKKGSNNSGEFLDILKEYPSFFQKAGLNAQEMFAIINQQVSEGVYSDKGVDAIKEATISLGENTKIVKDALRPLGESVNLQIRQKVEAGKSFEAMQLISSEMNKLGKNSSVAQTILADVFKGAGEDSEKFVRNLDNVTLSLKDVKNQTDANQDANLILSKSYNSFIQIVAGSDSVISKWWAKQKTIFAGELEFLGKVINGVKGLKIVRRHLDENEKSTRRLTTAEKEELEQQKKIDAQRKKNTESLKKNTKAVKENKKEKDKITSTGRTREEGIISTGEIATFDPVKDAQGQDKTIEANNKAHNDKLLAQDKALNEQRKADAISNEQQIAAARTQILGAAIAAAGQILADSISFGIDAQVAAAERANDEEIERNNEQAETEKEILNQKLEDGFITEKEFKTESAKIDDDLRSKNEKLEKDTKTRIAVADKKKALFDIGIATAVAIARVIPNPIAMALAATLGALQLAVVAARPIPKFAEGEIDIKGKSHSQGGILAEIEGRESIINTIGTANAPKMLNDINNGLFKDSDIQMMKNNDNYSYNMLQLNGLIDEIKVNGSLTKETNKILSNTVNMNDQGKMFAVRNYEGHIVRYIIKD